MSKSGEMFLRMLEKDYNELSEQQRSVFTYAEKIEINEYENNKIDPIYMVLYKEKLRVSKKLKEYLFQKRNQ